MLPFCFPTSLMSRNADAARGRPGRNRKQRADPATRRFGSPPGTRRSACLEERHERHLQQLRDDDHDERRQVEHAADRRQHLADRPQERNVSALSTPDSGPSGATHDRIACASTTMISSHSAALTSATTRRREEEWNARAREARSCEHERVGEQPQELEQVRRRERRPVDALPPSSTRRSGFTIQSVSAITACPSGSRNGARSHCIAKRSSSAYVNSPNTTSSK